MRYHSKRILLWMELISHPSGIAFAREFLASVREFSECRKFVLLLCVHQAFDYEILSFKNSMKRVD